MTTYHVAIFNLWILLKPFHSSKDDYRLLTPLFIYTVKPHYKELVGTWQFSSLQPDFGYHVSVVKSMSRMFNGGWVKDVMVGVGSRTLWWKDGVRNGEGRGCMCCV